MKTILICLFLAFTANSVGQTAYTLSVKDEDGKDIDVSKYQGKKLLVIVAKKQEPDLQKFKQLNALYKTARRQAEFLVVVTGEFDSRTNNFFTKENIDSLGLNFPVVSLGKTKRGNSGQSALFKFLTDRNQNGRFDIDVEVPWQMFALTESGKLYAVMLGADDIESGRLLEILNAKTN